MTSRLGGGAHKGSLWVDSVEKPHGNTDPELMIRMLVIGYCFGI